MKKYSIILIIILFIGNITNVFSQELSSKEKKQLKKEIRKLLKDPVKYKYFKNNLKTKDNLLNSQTKDISFLKRERNKVQHSLNVCRDSISGFENAIRIYDKESKNIANVNASNNCVDDTGIKYRLQIGLYKEFDISSFLQQLKLMSFEVVDDGLYRYSIGNFDNEFDAELFKDALRQMGLKDAFVSFYLDGKRIPKN